jgi:hypothetical protein
VLSGCGRTPEQDMRTQIARNCKFVISQDLGWHYLGTTFNASDTNKMNMEQLQATYAICMKATDGAKAQESAEYDRKLGITH